MPSRRTDTWTVLGDTLDTILSTPLVYAVYVLAAPLTAIPVLGNLVNIIAGAIATVLYADGTNVKTTDTGFGTRLLILLVDSVIAGFGILIGLLLLVVPGLWLLARLYILTPVAILEDHGIAATLTETYERTAGHALMIGGFLLVLFLLSLGLAFGVVRVTDSQTLASVAVTAVLGPVAPALQFVLYRRFSQSGTADDVDEWTVA